MNLCVILYSVRVHFNFICSLCACVYVFLLVVVMVQFNDMQTDKWQNQPQFSFKPSKRHPWKLYHLKMEQLVRGLEKSVYIGILLHFCLTIFRYIRMEESKWFWKEREKEKIIVSVWHYKHSAVKMGCE